MKWLTEIPRRMPGLRSFVKDVAQGYSSILFLEGQPLGLGLLVVTFSHSNIGGCGLIAIIFSRLVLGVLNIRVEAFRKAVLYNGLLTGLFIGYMFKLDVMVLALTIVATLLSLGLTAVWDSILQPQGLPVLSLPFTFSALLLALARPMLSNLTDASVYFVEMPLPGIEQLGVAGGGLLTDFLRAMGSIFCSPDPRVGFFVLALALLRSPLLGSFLCVGFTLGYTWETLLKFGSADVHFTHYFNYSLTFVALSLVLLSPSRRSLSVGVIATLVCCFVTLSSLVFWSAYQIPIVPFAFNLTALLTLRATRWLLPAVVQPLYAGTPELTLDRVRLFRLRQRSGEIGVFCPFSGVWEIQQGFDGPWTHRGHWRHALDFVMTGADGKTFSKQGLEPEDYYAFGQPVLAPMDGWVVTLCSSQPDNPIGTVDNQKNWGNYLVIRSSEGYCAVLAHLKKDSITPKVGDRITAGSRVAACGNSGYSQEPHLHLQIQWTDAVGGFTVPFHLLNYKIGSQLTFRGLPVVKDQVEPFAVNVALDRALGFRIGEKLGFSLRHNESSNFKSIQLEVGMDEYTGALFLSDGVDRLYLGRLGAQHYFYGYTGARDSVLADLFKAAPRIPLIYGDPVKFSDAIPIKLFPYIFQRWGKTLGELTAVSRGQKLDLLYSMNPDLLEIHGKDSSIKLDPAVGILEFSAKGRKYARVV